MVNWMMFILLSMPLQRLNENESGGQGGQEQTEFQSFFSRAIGESCRDEAAKAAKFQGKKESRSGGIHWSVPCFAITITWPMPLMLRDTEIIDLLGGTLAVARLCQIKPPSVSEWRRYGIPSARRMYLQAIRPDVFKAVHQDTKTGEVA